VKNPDVRKAAWLQMRRTTWSGFTGLTNRLIDSPALTFVGALRERYLLRQMAEHPKTKEAGQSPHRQPGARS
jgi:hypothetical protein